MSELNESKENRNTENMGENDIPRDSEGSKWKDYQPGETSKAYEDAFKALGLVSDNSENSDNSESNEKSDSSETENNGVDESKENQYSKYLEKGDDGKYYDKETGKSYDSVDDWKKELTTLLKKYESTADFCEEKAKKEWARYKNSEQNGETEAEKRNHYKLSQDHYERAKVCREKAAHIKEKLGMSQDSASE